MSKKILTVFGLYFHSMNTLLNYCWGPRGDVMIKSISKYACRQYLLENTQLQWSVHYKF